jgi:REP element-mobilizing transposase RayT
MVFSTKDRRPYLGDEVLPRVQRYIGGIVNQKNAAALAVGGMSDHVHLLVRAHQQTSIADLARDVKASSSRWIHDTLGIAEFGWQNGYGAFTVSASQMSRAQRYIENQAEHHRTRDFSSELKALLRAHGIAYDPTYLD